MTILHIAPHLGGGVGKAHAALAEAGGDSSRHVYALLEAPRDRGFVERIAAAGARVVVEPDVGALSALVERADMVQVEWWSHPRLYALLATVPLPPMRLALWTHISGLGCPRIPAALAAAADHLFLTSACSLDAPGLAPLIRARPDCVSVANSGFGFACPARRSRAAGRLRIGYLGTLDFAKMHPAFFDIVDAVEEDIRVSLWGRLDAAGEVAARASAMRHPERIRFEGYADDPAAVLAGLDLFLYPLAPGHYGTGENALVEAMSAGACPLVLDNPAERAIVRAGETGLVATSVADCAERLGRAVRDPSAIAALGERAAKAVARSHSPEATLAVLDEGYRRIARLPKRRRDFATALGPDPGSWFLASLGADTMPAAPAPGDPLFADSGSKGSLGHFRRCFPGHRGLALIGSP